MELMKLNTQLFAGGTVDLGQSGQMHGRIVWGMSANNSANKSTGWASLQVQKVTSTSTTTTYGNFFAGMSAGNIGWTQGNYYGSCPADGTWATLLTFDNIEVYHNSNGTGSMTLSGKINGPSGTSWSGLTVGAEQTVALDTIPRYATINYYTVSATSETTIQVNWNADVVCDAVQYSIGSGWVGTSGTSFTIGGLSANTFYGIRIRAKRADSQLWTESGTAYATTYAYPYVTSAPNFTVGNNVTFSLYNPLSRYVSIAVRYNSNSPRIATVYTSGTTATYASGNDSTAWYNSMPTITSGTYNASATYGSVTTSNVSGTVSIPSSQLSPNYPKITNVVVNEDTNADTVALTKNNQYLIAYKSRVKATFTTEMATGASRSSTTAYYKITDTSGNISYRALEQEREYVSSTTGILYYYTPLPNIATDTPSSKVHIQTADSRNQNSTMYEMDMGEYFIPYIPFSIDHIEAQRVSTYSNKMLLDLKIKWWNGKFSENVPNNLVVQWKVKEGNGSYSDWQTFTNFTNVPTEVTDVAFATTGSYADEETFEEKGVEISNPHDSAGAWDYLSQYRFIFRISDGGYSDEETFIELNYETLQQELTSTVPIYDAWEDSDKNKYFNVNGQYMMNNMALIDSGYEGHSTWSKGYVRYGDGTQICYGSFTFTPDYFAWGSLYAYDINPYHYFAKEFVATPFVMMESSGGPACMIARTRASSTAITYITVTRPNLLNDDIYMTYIAIGRWDNSLPVVNTGSTETQTGGAN